MKENWKEEALAKQLEFKKSLGFTKSGTYGKKNKEYENFLHDTDALKGGNFYCHNDPKEWQSLKEWSKKDKGERVNFTAAGLTNMLRSEHIPFNLFYPLEKIRNTNPELLNTFLEKLFNDKIKVDKVNRIKIEFASELPKSKLLDDNTSFDAYIEFQDGGSKCGLGIEVKYTEKSYPYGKTEKDRMFNQEDSEYNRLTRLSRYYNEENIAELKLDQLKQIWRNHLLGIKLLALNELDSFHSVHIYPEGNVYQKEASEKYINCLAKGEKQSFVPITFERFIEVAEVVFTSEEHKTWIQYLKDRY